MRTLVLIFVLIVVPFLASGQEPKYNGFATAEAAKYADAAKIYISGYVNIVTKQYNADTMFVGYPDTLDPPQAYLDSLSVPKLKLLPYSVRRPEATDEVGGRSHMVLFDRSRHYDPPLTIHIVTPASPDTIALEYDLGVPRRERAEWGDIVMQPVLVRDSSAWRIFRKGYSGRISE